jgi:ribosome biogenesis protein Nip4
MIEISRAITDQDIPELEHGSGSWMVVRKATQEHIIEISKDSKKLLYRFNAKNVEILDIGEYLYRLQQRIDSGEIPGKSYNK